MDLSNCSIIIEPSKMSITSALITVASGLLGTIIGGMITYHITLAKTKFDLKRDLYLELLGLLMDGRTFKHAINRNLTNEEIVDFMKWLYSMDLARSKIDILDDSEVKGIFNRLFDSRNEKVPHRFFVQLLGIRSASSIIKYMDFISNIFNSMEEYDKITEQISSAIKKDLSMSLWQQFRK